MAEIRLIATLAAPPRDVWNLIGGFNALPDWQPSVLASHLDEGGRVRRLSMATGGTVVQELLEEGDFFHSYSMSESPLPVTGYTATLGVGEGKNGACVLEWTSRFEPLGVGEEDAIASIKTLHERGIANLRRIFGK
jgi:hypothetical protein